MTRKQTLTRVRREAPTVVSLLDELSDDAARVAVKREAWNELVKLVDPHIGAKEASVILGVQGPNLYGMLRSEAARELFSDQVKKPDPTSGWVPVVNHTAASGRQYRLRDIEALAKARRSNGNGHRMKRKQEPVKAASEAQVT
jgi:hypothetical protein